MQPFPFSTQDEAAIEKCRSTYSKFQIILSMTIDYYRLRGENDILHALYSLNLQVKQEQPYILKNEQILFLERFSTYLNENTATLQSLIQYIQKYENIIPKPDRLIDAKIYHNLFVLCIRFPDKLSHASPIMHDIQKMKLEGHGYDSELRIMYRDQMNLLSKKKPKQEQIDLVFEQIKWLVERLEE